MNEFGLPGWQLAFAVTMSGATPLFGFTVSVQVGGFGAPATIWPSMDRPGIEKPGEISVRTLPLLISNW